MKKYKHSKVLDKNQIIIESQLHWLKVLVTSMLVFSMTLTEGSSLLTYLVRLKTVYN